MIKLNSFGGLNSWSAEVARVVIHFAQGQETKQGVKTIQEMPQNAAAIMIKVFQVLIGFNSY